MSGLSHARSPIGWQLADRLGAFVRAFARAFAKTLACIALVAFALALINYAVDEVTNPRLRKIRKPATTERSAAK